MRQSYVLLLLAAVGFAQQSIPKSPAEYRQMGGRSGRLKPGDSAADFDLKMLHSDNRVRLSAFQGQKPVALVFGSFTWPPFRASVGALNAMHEKYKGQVEFLLVYIREAHPTDGWQSPANEKQGVLLPTAKNMGEKEEHASSCVRKLDIRFNTVVDNMDNRVELDYAGWPDRLYLVGKDGRVAYKGAPGPGGFKPPELEAAIQRELSSR